MKTEDKLTTVEVGYTMKKAEGKQRCRFCERFTAPIQGYMGGCLLVDGGIYVDGHCNRLVVSRTNLVDRYFYGMAKS